MFVRLGEVGATSETAEISKYRRTYHEDFIFAIAVEELGINLRPFQVDAQYCVCTWLLLVILGVTCFPDGSHAYC
jgi:hypothetical protein